MKETLVIQNSNSSINTSQKNNKLGNLDTSNKHLHNNHLHNNHLHNSHSHDSKLKQYIKAFAQYLGNLLLKIAIVVAIGIALSYALYVFKAVSIGSAMRIIGAIIGLIGLSSILGQFGMRSDYNYNMSKMRDSKLREAEHDGFLTASSLSFLLWMGTSGTIVFLIGDAIARS